MQTCTDTRDMLQGNPADPNTLPPAIRFDLGERAGLIRSGLPAGTEGKDTAGRRRSPAKIKTDLEAQYQADLEKLNSRYATRMDGVAARVKPVAVRRKEALARMDDLRAIVRRTNPVMDEAGIDALISAAITKAYGDLADANMAR
jgi:hypothetical protein